jgi:SAM-dependent methyltransferase
MQCRLCGGGLSPWLEMPIDAKKDELTPFNRLFRCDRCATGMLTPQPRAEEIAGLYRVPAYYTHGEDHIRYVPSGFWDKVLTKLAWKADFQTPFEPDQIARFLPAGGSVCDLGCGHAIILQRFKELGFTVTGVEPDPSSRELAAKAGVDVLPGTAEALPPELADRQFDLVIMTHALEHCVDPIRALTNAYTLTKEGGHFYCEVPNCGCLHFETLTVCSENFDSPRHLWFFTAAGVRRAIEDRGFTFDSWRYSGFTRHHSPSWRAWEITIFDRLAKRGDVREGTRHTFGKSVSILAKTAFAPASKKYDCVGVIAKKRAALL